MDNPDRPHHQLLDREPLSNRLVQLGCYKNRYKEFFSCPEQYLFTTTHLRLSENCQPHYSSLQFANQNSPLQNCFNMIVFYTFLNLMFLMFILTFWSVKESHALYKWNVILLLQTPSSLNILITLKGWISTSSFSWNMTPHIHYISYKVCSSFYYILLNIFVYIPSKCWYVYLCILLSREYLGYPAVVTQEFPKLGSIKYVHLSI